jgi:DNA helicase TIP49 (TBP-interacting protein)
VIEFRKIENIRQIYEQIANIKKYIFDSYAFGELSQLSRRPSLRYIEKTIEKRVQ